MNRFTLHELEDSRFIVDTTDLIGGGIINNGCWERELEDLYSRIIKPDFVIIDAGANIGYHTVKFAKLGKLVHAFEPILDTYNFLSGNIAVNELSNKIIPYNIALGDTDGVGEIDSIENMEALNLHFTKAKLDVTRNSGSTSIKQSEEGDITIAKLDNFDIKPDLIKIDVEGYEGKLLSGAIRTIMTNLPIILIEIHKDENFDSTIDKLLNLGYRIHNPGIGTYKADYICIHPGSKYYQTVADIIW